MDDIVARCVSIIQNEFSGATNTEELFTTVKDHLPLLDDEFKIKNVKGTVTCYMAEIDCNLATPVAIEEFAKSYMQKSGETIRRSTPKYHGSRGVHQYSVYYHCHHKTNHVPSHNPVENSLKSKPSKIIQNNDCRFSLSFHLHRDTITNQYPCYMEMKWNHNHPVKSLQALSFKDIPTHVKEKIMNMFECGYTPGLAYREFVKELTRECENDLELHQVLADRSKAPKRRDFNFFYKKYKVNKYGPKDLAFMFKRLAENIDELSQKNNKVKLNEFNAEEML